MKQAVISLSVFLVLLGAVYWLWTMRVKTRTVGSYSYVVSLEVPGGDIPFGLNVNGPNSDGEWSALILNDALWGGDSDPITVEMIGDSKDFEIRFPHYDSVIELKEDSESGLLQGVWRKTRGESDVASINATAESAHGPNVYRSARSDSAHSDFNGTWRVQFGDSTDFAIGQFDVDIDGNALGTFLTTTGDYGHLSGRVDGKLMWLSVFDGAHAFLFHARMQEDGTIQGDFWSGNWWHETWTAVRDDDAQLPDAFEQTSITDGAALEELVFKDTEGNPTRVLDALDETKAKARILEIFGTWCPNCSDAGRELVALKEKYSDDLGIVGLAFEVTEDFERSAEQVKRHHAYIGSDWEVLVAGLSDKAKATETLGFLDKVRSYPTLVFIDEHNDVKAIYSGFSGPATGDAYTQQRERFEELIESMLE